MLGAALVGERFELLETAGSGGMGTVYRAIDHATGNVVAVKVLRDAGPESISRFAQEARVLGEVEHPHVVRYVMHGISNAGEPFLVMEWLEGQSLAERLKQKPLSIEETVDLGRRVASALGAAHGRGYVHRDIKPTNLFLANGEVARVKLLDFGIARLDRVTTALTKTGMLIGTPGYMAPEQAKGERGGIDARADIFSLGCVLFECLTGQPAFHGMHVIALLAKLLMEEPPRVRELCPDVPQPLDDLIGRMLSKEPERRPADGSAVFTALDRLGSWDAMAISHRPVHPDSLTHAEKRLVSVVAVVPSTAEHVEESGVTLGSVPIPGKLLAEVRRAAQPFGAKLEEIANGMLIALLVGTGPATDQAAVAARCALRMRLLLPNSPIVLLTGRGESTGRLPVGEIFENAVSLLEKVQSTDIEGMICIDDVTRALLDVRFDVVEAHGSIVLQGEQDVGAEARTLLGKPSPFVGRDRELRNLLELVDEAIDEQRARAALVTAEAGGGKSRLRYEFLKRLKSAHPDMVVSTGRGDSIGAGSAFALLGSAFRSALGITADEPLEYRRSKLESAVRPYLGADDSKRVVGFLGEMIGIPFADENDPRVRAARQNPSIMADQIQSAYVDLVRAVVASHPVLVVLEDLHWGDGPSIKLLDAALRELSDKPFIVVAFARPEVRDVFPRLWAGREMQLMTLGGLPKRGAESLVRSMLGDAADAQTMATIVERAGGNAFYLEELIRAVSESRRHSFPETVLGMVEARISAIDPEARRTLRAASVFGKTFWNGGLHELLRDQLAGDATAHIKQLLDQELIVRHGSSRFSGEAEYEIRHALVREGAYAMLTDRDRALGHELAGEWLVRIGEQDPMVLAKHFEQGTMPAKAAPYYAKASVQAMRGGDFASAIARAEKGLAVGAEGKTSIALRDTLALAYFLTAQYAKCFETAEGMIAEATTTDSGYARSLGNAVASAIFLGKFDVLANLVPKLLAVEPLQDDVAEFARSLYGVFITLVVAGQQDNARIYLDRLQQVTVPYRETELLAAAWADFALIFSAREIDHDAWKGLEHCKTSASRFEAAGAREFLAITNAHLGLSYLQLGLLREADALFDRVLATPDAGNLALTYATYYKSLLLVETGKLEEAFAVAGSLVKSALAASDFVLLWCARLTMADVFIAQDKLDEADGVLDELGEANAFLPFLRAKFGSLRSEIRRKQGRAADAVVLAADSIASGKAGPRYNYGEDPLQLRHALALHAAGDLDGARRSIREARDDILECAAKITNESVRRAYLENLGAHKLTLTLAREWLGE